jgi:hypothetical protein
MQPLVTQLILMIITNTFLEVGVMAADGLMAEVDLTLALLTMLILFFLELPILIILAIGMK